MRGVPGPGPPAPWCGFMLEVAASRLEGDRLTGLASFPIMVHGVLIRALRTVRALSRDGAEMIRSTRSRWPYFVPRWLLPAVVLVVVLAAGGGAGAPTRADEVSRPPAGSFDPQAHARYCPCNACRGATCCCGRGQATDAGSPRVALAAGF